MVNFQIVKFQAMKEVGQNPVEKTQIIDLGEIKKLKEEIGNFLKKKKEDKDLNEEIDDFFENTKKNFKIDFHKIDIQNEESRKKVVLYYIYSILQILNNENQYKLLLNIFYLDNKNQLNSFDLDNENQLNSLDLDNSLRENIAQNFINKITKIKKKVFEELFAYYDKPQKDLFDIIFDLWKHIFKITFNENEYLDFLYKSFIKNEYLNFLYKSFKEKQYTSIYDFIVMFTQKQIEIMKELEIEIVLFQQIKEAIEIFEVSHIKWQEFVDRIITALQEDLINKENIIRTGAPEEKAKAKQEITTVQQKLFIWLEIEKMFKEIEKINQIAKLQKQNEELQALNKEQANQIQQFKQQIEEPQKNQEQNNSINNLWRSSSYHI